MNMRRLLNLMESTDSPQIVVQRPRSVDPDDMDMIVNMISEGGQVSLDGLKHRVMQSEMIGYVKVGEKIVSVRALKNPNASYKESVFYKAGVADDAFDYDFELGWSFTLPDYRNKGFSETLARKLLSNAQGSVYATVRADNVPPMRLLDKLGFMVKGKPFKGMSGMIVLLVK